MIIDEDYIEHFGVRGMKWGVRKSQNGSVGKPPEKLAINKTDTAVTKKVKEDYNNLDSKQFRSKYMTSKRIYAKRVSKHADPYQHRVNQMAKRASKKLGENNDSTAGGEAGSQLSRRDKKTNKTISRIEQGKLNNKQKVVSIGVGVGAYVTGVKATQKLLGDPSVAKMLISVAVGATAANKGYAKTRDLMRQHDQKKLSELRNSRS